MFPAARYSTSPTRPKPAPDARPCVVPIGAAAALAWAAGTLDDTDLLLRAPLVPEAVFVVDLPDRRAYREALHQVTRWRSAGAVCLIARTGNLVVDDHLTRDGAWATYRENSEQYRFFMPPAEFSAWLDKITRRRRPLNQHTKSYPKAAPLAATATPPGAMNGQVQSTTAPQTNAV